MEEHRALTRPIDELGRIIIPKDICQTLGWGKGTLLEVEINDAKAKSISLREVVPCCTFCRAKSKDLLQVAKGYICPECAAQIK